MVGDDLTYGPSSSGGYGAKWMSSYRKNRVGIVMAFWGLVVCTAITALVLSAVHFQKDDYHEHLTQFAQLQITSGDAGVVGVYTSASTAAVVPNGAATATFTAGDHYGMTWGPTDSAATGIIRTKDPGIYLVQYSGYCQTNDTATITLDVLAGSTGVAPSFVSMEADTNGVFSASQIIDLDPNTNIQLRAMSSAVPVTVTCGPFNLMVSQVDH